MQRFRKLLMAALGIVFVVSICVSVSKMLDKQRGSQSYQDALAIATAVTADSTAAPPPPETEQPQLQTEIVWIPEPVADDPVIEELQQIDLNALREVNPELVGWIRIPDTLIDYPIMQGEDNEFYLKHDWKGDFNTVGSIFLDHLSSPGFTDYNTIVYGHNMNNGSMFAQLRQFCTMEFFEKRQYVYVLTDVGCLRYDIFSSYLARLDSPAYGQSFQQRSTREKFLQNALDSTVIDIGIEPGIQDRILTLSTCSDAGHSTRWVVHARLKMIQIEVPVEETESQ